MGVEFVDLCLQLMRFEYNGLGLIWLWFLK